MWRRRRTRDRRRAGRKSVDWEARYWIEGRRNETSSPCTVLDVTRGGAGLLVLGHTPVRASDTIAIEIEKMAGTVVMLILHGIVEHVDATADDDAIRIGVSLNFSGPHEQRIAQTLFSA
jgi:hypothetical protein